MSLNPLLLTTAFPLAGVVVMLLLKAKWKNAIRWTALLTSLVTFGLSLWMLSQFNSASPDLQFEINQAWFSLGGNPIGFHIGVDGISILMVLLTTFLTPLAILSTWKAVDEKVKGFMAFFLMLEVGMLGVFLSLDMVLFYIFWEFTLIPMYFLIGLWGGERRVYAAVKFFLYTMAGSVLMLAGILWIGLQYGSFDLTQLV
ncbi:MAG: proton-conducting transporter membrane subunit, partial [Anaerolineaceae bacterium]|nr:proton-conducting transporter membrane subunit [Anaerolineaceae bacterium]